MHILVQSPTTLERSKNNSQTACVQDCKQFYGLESIVVAPTVNLEEAKDQG
jgi:hypothetical protein